MGRRRKVPEDLMGIILNEGSETAERGEGSSWSGGSSDANRETDFPSSASEGVLWEDRPERVGITFNLSKQVITELESLRHELQQEGNVRPSRSEVAELALRIAVEDVRERGGKSELARRLDRRMELKPDATIGDTDEANRTTRLSVDEAGFILETTYDENGEIVDEDVVAAVADLPVVDEYVDDLGRLVSVSKDEPGNTFEQVVDEEFNVLETRLLPNRD